MGVPNKNSVIAGLDPAIYLSKEAFIDLMDARAFAAPKGLRPSRRVEPAHDSLCEWRA
jgi:hypothetical protein